MKYSLWNMVARGGDGGGGGGSASERQQAERDAANLAAAVSQGRGSTVTSARPEGSSGRSDTTTYGGYSGGGGGSDAAERQAAANAARIAAEKAAYDQQQAQAAAQAQAQQQAAAANAARIAAERATYDQQQAAEKTAADNAARIAAEKAAYQAPSAPAAPSSGFSLTDIVNQLIGVTPAEAKPLTTPEEFAAAQRALAAAKQTGVSGGVPIGYKTPAEIAKEADLAERQAQAAIDAEAMRTGFPTGLTTIATAPTAQPVPEKTIPQRIAEFVNPTGQDLRFSTNYTLPDVGLRIGREGTSAITTEGKSPFSAYENAVVQNTRSPFESVVQSTIQSASQPAISPAAIRAAQEKSMADLAAAQAAAPAKQVFSEYGAEPVVPFPVPRPPQDELAAKVAAAAAPAAKVAAPVTSPVATAQKGILDQLMSGITDANAKRIAELEKQNQFAGGNKEQVAAALGVDPSQLQSRIVNYDGQQKVDYFTKGLDQVLGEMIGAPFQAVSNLFTPNVNNLPRGSYVRDPRLSDMFTQNVPSKGYGPYGDLTAEEYRQQYGGRDTTTSGAGAPVTTPTVPVTPTPVTPQPPQANAAWSRTRTGLPFDPYNYGYGGEYTYYSAKGGHVAPLSKIRK
jgi:hypothetical protein